MADNGWLTQEHPLYTLKKAEWATNERRFRGGSGVLTELQRFDWEAGPSGILPFDRSQEQAIQAEVEAKLLAGATTTHYAARQLHATYINFPESFASLLIGHLMRQAPTKDQSLNFGTLGTVQRAEGQALPSNAELVYYNADGVGNDGSQWDNYWTSVGKRSMAFGHLWLMVEAARIRAESQADEIAGRRPYLLSYSPLEVTNWFFDEGQLQWAIVKFRYRAPKLEGQTLAGNKWVDGRRLMVRAGFQGFGTTYAGGGWWDFDEQGAEISGRSGTWQNTGGQIPMWVHYYERDKDQMSRSGAFELGQAAVAYMNMASAADYDAWDAAQSITYFLGVDAEGFNLAADKYKAGGKLVPVPMNEMSKTAPTIYDGSAGAVASGVFQARLDAIRAVVREVASLEASGGPDASGLSKQMGFLDAKSPRLRLLASEFESSQMTALHFLEKRFGDRSGVEVTPEGAVAWPRDFDLAPLLDQIREFLDVQQAAGVTSTRLTARAVVRAAEETGLLTDDDDSDEIETEIRIGIEAGAAGDLRDQADLTELTDAEPAKPAADGNIETTVAQVLNGAQITAAVAIVTAVTKGELPRDTGVQMLQAFFNIETKQAEAIMGSAGTKTPTTPNPQPAHPGGQPAAPPVEQAA